MTNTQYKIGLAGCGKMGSAMVRAWLGSGLIAHIDILDPHDIPGELIHAKEVAFFKNETDFAANANNWDVLVIAIKPQTMDEFCSKIGRLPAELPLLSIATGQTLAIFAAKFGAQQSVIRTMPNTPASIGKGMTVACANGNVNPAQKALADALLDKLGKVAWLKDESDFDAVTGLSGSGPAYIFYMIEAMAQAGIDMGLPSDFSMTLARQTVIGAAALADTDNHIPASRLRENVTSPNGTTAAALEILMDGTFQEIMTRAIARAAARSKELSR